MVEMILLILKNVVPVGIACTQVTQNANADPANQDPGAV
jgi:hypothetical protein